MQTTIPFDQLKTKLHTTEIADELLSEIRKIVKASEDKVREETIDKLGKAHQEEMKKKDSIIGCLEGYIIKHMNDNDIYHLTDQELFLSWGHTDGKRVCSYALPKVTEADFKEFHPIIEYDRKHGYYFNDLVLLEHRRYDYGV
jgi:hypothetical protein